MLLDAFNIFATDVATGDVGTNLVGDVIDLSVARDIGAGKPIYLNVVVTTGITAASAGTYQVVFTTADNAALTTNPVNIASSAALVTGTSAIAAGTSIMRVALPSEGSAYKQFVGIREIVATENTTAGKISAFLTFEDHAYQAYPQAQVQP